MVEQAQASILILTFNGLKYTRMCIDSILANTNISFEIVIVDQGSSDGTINYLQQLTQQHANVKVIANGRNVGYAAGCNQASEVAKGEYLIFLNNDVIVTPDWLSNLIDPFGNDPRLVGTGPMSNETGELQLDSYSRKRIRRIPEDICAYSISKRKLMAGKVWYFHRLAGFCLVVKRNAFNEIGGFNEWLTFFEDDELCYRIIGRGYRLAVIPSVFVYHFGSSTFKTVRADIETLMQINRAKFLSTVVGHKRAQEAEIQPKVSVITTTFNRRTELERALRSIVSQTYKNWEAIVVNDGGSDVGDMIESFHDQRMVYVNSQHLGRSEALNLANTHAQGKYFAYLDDDDLWYPEHLQLCVDFLERNPSIGTVYSKSLRKSVKRTARGKKELQQSIDPRMELNFTRLLEPAGNWIPNLAVVHRAELLQRAGPFKDLPTLEDWEFLLRLSSFSEFAHLPVVTGEFYVDLSRETRNEKLQKVDPASFSNTLNFIRWSQQLTQTSEQLRITARRLAKKGDKSEAVKLLERALRMNPFNYLALASLARLLRETDQLDSVNPFLERFLSERADKSTIWKLHAELLMRQNEQSKALRALELALVSRTEDAEAADIYRLMSACYSQLGMNESAMACLLKSKETYAIPKTTGLHALPEGRVLKRLFKGGSTSAILRGMSYYYLYSRRWGHRAAVRKILRAIRLRI